MRYLCLIALGAIALLGMDYSANTKTSALCSVTEDEGQSITGGCDTYTVDSANQVCGSWGGGWKFWEYCSSISLLLPVANDPNAYFSLASTGCTTSCGYACGTKVVLVPCVVGTDPVPPIDPTLVAGP